MISVFATRPNLIGETGAELSVLITTSYMASLILGSLFHHLIWDYKDANVNHIQSAVSNIDWEFLSRGANVNKKVYILNEFLKNIFDNFIPNRK